MNSECFMMRENCGGKLLGYWEHLRHHYRMLLKANAPFCIALFLSVFDLSNAAETRPNFLIIMTDQQTHSAMSNAGNPHLETPGMDRIAQNGIRFEKTYVTQPLCGPARTSLYTGK